MIKLYDGGAWLINGKDLVQDIPQAGEIIQTKLGKAVLDKGEAA